jgi:ATP/maltotriose-dependent transcriptional regulator MalT
LWAQALVISGICHILEGRMAVSEQELDQAAALVQKNSLRHEQYWVWIGQARVAMIKDEYDEAIHILRLLLSESLENNSPWTALYGTTLLSQVFKASGQEEDQEGLKLISEQIIADISRQTTIGPLQSDFNRTKARWQAGHYYP